MKEEQNHFIKNIEIKNFKCFENFSAEGFGRVNLIGGKNNVGKTAFMEACYITSNYASVILNHKEFTYNYGASSINREWLTFEIIKSLIVLQENRESINFYMEWIKEETTLSTFSKARITLNDTFAIDIEEAYIRPEYKYHNWANYFHTDSSLTEFRKNKYFHNIYKRNNPPQIFNTNFTTPCNTNHMNLKDMIDTLKLKNKHEEIEIILGAVFKISSIDIIKNKVMLKENGLYRDLNYFGDGLKHFLHIILSILVNEDSVIFIDEIENGIHYTNLDKLWEIILTISKEQNVQVFATTHSKECIESYARVAKKLKDENITFIELCKREEEIKAFVYPYDWFIDEIEQEHEVRGCL